ncbi:MAG: pyridoxal phosphate-dependent aminotransferase [Planctomycetaceae bacterium]|nr:pyridoxal phosphate-dependent aminotransferase [Planctomycetaceae bacterium]
MLYEFDRLVDRRDQGSEKWELAKTAFGDRAEEGIAVSVADMDFPTAPEIADAIRDAADRLVFGYTVPTSAYYEAVVSWMQRRHNWTIRESQIAFAPGIVTALYHCLRAFTRPGDGVLIQTPVYSPFYSSVRTTGRTLITNPLRYEEGRYTIDFADLERKAALPETKMMILCSPHNPVGRDWTCQELEQIATICARNDVLVVSDEIHFDLVFPPHRHTVFAQLPQRLTKNSVVCTSPSKSFNIAGLQVSNIVFQDESMKRKYIEAGHTCGFHFLNSLAYVACIAAYNRAEPWFNAMLRYVQENDQFVREFCRVNLPDLKIVPLEATYLQWMDFSAICREPRQRSHLLHRQAAVVFESGSVFGEGGNSFERFNIAYPRTTIAEVLERLQKITQW